MKTKTMYFIIEYHEVECIPDILAVVCKDESESTVVSKLRELLWKYEQADDMDRLSRLDTVVKDLASLYGVCKIISPASVEIIT